MDCLLAAKHVGRQGQLIGFELTDAMLRTSAKPMSSPGCRKRALRFFDFFLGTNKEVARKFGVRIPVPEPPWEFRKRSMSKAM
jgi:hypothetical protein